MKNSLVALAAVVACGAAVGLSLQADASTWTVYAERHVPVKDGQPVAGASEMSPVEQLTNAVQKAVSCDTVVIKPGVYDLAAELTPANPKDTYGDTYLLFDNKTINLTGEDATHWSKKTPEQEVVLKGGSKGRLVYGYAGPGRASSFRHITFEGGDADSHQGGAILFTGTEFIVPYQKGFASNCVFRANKAQQGGALFHVNAYDCLFEGNETIGGGGAAYGSTANGNGAITNDFIGCLFTNNVANGTGSGGGALRLVTAGRVRDCIFIDNRQTGCNGGAIIVEKSGPSSVIENCLFVGNRAPTGRGGAVCMTVSGNRIVGCAFTNNVAFRDGGAVYLAAAVSNCTFAANKTTIVPAATETYGGGAVYVNDENAEIVGCTFTDNESSHLGGAVRSSRQIRMLADCTFSNNAALRGPGGGVYSAGDFLALANCTFADNTSPTNGGAAYTTGYVPLMTNCVFRGNRAGSHSGALQCTGFTKISACSFSNNVAKSRYGALYASSFAKGGTVEGCTFHNNTNGLVNVGSHLSGARSVVDSRFSGWGDMHAGGYDRCVFDGCRFDYESYGGGMVLFDTSTGEGHVRNCLFRDCEVHIFINNSTGANVDIANCTFVSNQVTKAVNLQTGDLSDGYMIYSFRGGSPYRPSTNRVTNCIFVDNFRHGVRNDVCFYVTGTSVVTPAVNIFSHSAYETATFVNNPIDAGGLVRKRTAFTAGNPRYGDVPQYMPTRGSAARRAGVWLDWMAGETDLAGAAMPADAPVDLGCYQCTLPASGGLLLLR